jgi:hypothetical protein
VTVVHHRDPGGCRAGSPDLPGFSAAADHLPELRATVRAALAEIIVVPPDVAERDRRQAGTSRTHWSIVGGPATAGGGTRSGSPAPVHPAAVHPWTTPLRTPAS